MWGAESDGVCVALPGHGGGPVEATWEANLAAIARAVVGCEVVIGYSLGARIAAGLVVGGHVPRAVLISANPGIDDAERPARRAHDAAWAHLVRTRGVAAFVDAWEAQPLFASQAAAPEQAREARRARRLAHDPEQLARSLEVMGLAEMPDYRGAIDDRFHLIAGADDLKYVAIARALPAPLEVIERCGHDPTLEQPAALAAAIRRALGR
ncbi:MAG: alpha/beta fold hydrolase [Myxococcales bacterium]|nr:alpha/beta fold hydrolase [Myxococcales bacterium]